MDFIDAKKQFEIDGNNNKKIDIEKTKMAHLNKEEV